MMPILVTGDDVRSGTKVITLIIAGYGQHRSQWVKYMKSLDIFRSTSKLIFLNFKVIPSFIVTRINSKPETKINML